jgi:hypothetical protein
LNVRPWLILKIRSSGVRQPLGIALARRREGVALAIRRPGDLKLGHAAMLAGVEGKGRRKP